MDIKDIKKINDICEEINKYSGKLKLAESIIEPVEESVIYIGKHSTLNLRVAFRDEDGLNYDDYCNAINTLLNKYKDNLKNKFYSLMEQLKSY